MKNAKGRPELWYRPFHNDSTALKKTERNRVEPKRRISFANGYLLEVIHKTTSTLGEFTDEKSFYMDSRCPCDGRKIRRI
jgi:hypothetical protein